MQTYLPKHPLQRFCDIHNRLMADRRWTEGVTSLRYCALILTATDGAPGDIARTLRNTADELKQQSRWFGILRSDLRFVFAADLVRRQEPTARFRTRLDEARKSFRSVGLPRNEMTEAVALLICEQHYGRKPFPASLAPAMRAHYDEMKRNHRFLTGSDDLPVCALLAVLPQAERDSWRWGTTPSQLGQRCVNLYDGLRSQGMGRGNAQQLASHLLCLADADETTLVRRFVGLHGRFKEAGVSMWSSDFDELASLAWLDLPGDKVVRTVLDHRQAMFALPKKPDRSAAFSLAAGTALLELGLAGSSQSGANTQAALRFQHAMIAQQAAVAAAIAASNAAAAAAAAS